MAISGDIVIVGAAAEDGGPGNPVRQGGAVYVFERNQGGTNNWGEVVKLTASDAQRLDFFGNSVAISGDTAIVGAHRADGKRGRPLVESGAAYVFGAGPGESFNSQFGQDASGWKPVQGAWALRNGNYRIDLGATVPVVLGGPPLSTEHAGIYEDFTYSAKMRRRGGTSIEFQGLLIRGKRDGSDWENFLLFAYDYTGWWGVLFQNAAQRDWLASGDAPGVFNTGWKWNTLRVVARRRKVKFFVNGTLLWKGRYEKLPGGTVGLYANNIEGLGRLDVTWAKLERRD